MDGSGSSSVSGTVPALLAARKVAGTVPALLGARKVAGTVPALPGGHEENQKIHIL